jgi:hypothetical protein
VHFCLTTNRARFSFKRISFVIFVLLGCLITYSLELQLHREAVVSPTYVTQSHIQQNNLESNVHAIFQVIFSQTSELLERQSSMASSTEEMSANNDVSTTQHDTTDTEQKFGLYMREFDFLEYELESLEGESVDNFNWGVRRPSLSHLEGSVSSSRDLDQRLRDSFAEATPIMQKREGGGRGGGAAGAEESSDDDGSSQLSNRSSSNEQSSSHSRASSSVSTASSAAGGMFPPTSLPLDAIGKRCFSTPNSGHDS